MDKTKVAITANFYYLLLLRIRNLLNDDHATVYFQPQVLSNLMIYGFLCDVEDNKVVVIKSIDRRIQEG